MRNCLVALTAAVLASAVRADALDELLPRPRHVRRGSGWKLKDRIVLGDVAISRERTMPKPIQEFKKRDARLRVLPFGKCNSSRPEVNELSESKRSDGR